jgi:hypothetical protein
MQILSKKRNQSKNAIVNYTKHVLNSIYYQLPLEERKKVLITINDYTDGKIFIEVGKNL